MASPQVLAGVWEDIIAQNSAQLAGRKVRIYVEPADDEEEQDVYSLDAAIARLNNRTPEEITAARNRVLESASQPRSVPEGKTLADVIMGQWPGDESDEQITEALRKLS